MSQMLAKKIGITQVFDTDGNLVPATLLEAGPFVVTQKKTKEKDGYEAIQIGFLPAKEKGLPKPRLGFFKKAGVKPMRILKEVRGLPKMEEIKVGQELKAGDLFTAGVFVDVHGESKGKGFQGGMKRHNFKGGPASHGSMTHRRPAAAGETQNAKVYRGKRSPGHLGSERVTVQGLEILRVVPENHTVLLRGSAPGPNGNILFLTTSIKNDKKIRKRETAKLARQAEEAPAKEKGASKAKAAAKEKK